jgi:hypothetical protein
MKSLGVAGCGLVTSVLTAIGIVTIANLTGFSLFTLSIWVLVPVGAALTGFAAASGYYFGSLYFHKRPSIGLLVQMVVIAGFTQFLIYYMEYATLVLEDGKRVADYLGFSEYLNISLTKSHYRFGRMQADTGEAGDFGYLMAILQFVGFLIGGICVYGYLLSKPVCPTCALFFRSLSKKAKTFLSIDDAGPYYDGLFATPVDGPEFAEKIRANAKVKAQKGSVLVTTTLHGCPSCKSQMIEDKVQIFNGREWKDLDTLDRRTFIPDGLDLVSVFRG